MNKSIWKNFIQVMILSLFLLPAFLYTWLIMGPYAEPMELKNTRAVVFISVVAAGSLLFHLRYSKLGWIASFAGTLLIYSAIYKAATFLPEISTLPWSLSWSEGSRFYNASLFFSGRIYGESFPTSVLHPTRYMMQSIPFLVSNAPLWLHRAWQVVLWLGMSLLAGSVLGKRFGGGWGLTLFSFLFLFQGPVYYHLLVMVVIMGWGFKSNRFRQSMVIIIFASIWAGISRINWYPVPGLIGTAIYLMDIPVKKQSIWRYLLPPIAWTVVGTAVAFISQYAYIIFSGNPVEQFGSSLTSDLLWYRLWPNATFSLGIVRSVWRISFPALLLILTRWLPNFRRFHWIRSLGLAGIIGVLLGGGIIVSVKIGGGSNLHNMDAYMVLLLIIGAGFYYRKVEPETLSPLRAQGVVWPLVFFVLFVPIRDLSQVGGVLPKYNLETAQVELAELNQQVLDVTKNGGDVLFINERHLLATHLIEGVPIIPDYELVFLMEMAMGNNRVYLEKFYDDLRSHRFDLIVAGKQNPNYQDLTRAFAEENNVWVDRVTIPLLCYYQVATELSDAEVSLLIPKADSCE